MSGTVVRPDAGVWPGGTGIGSAVLLGLLFVLLIGQAHAARPGSGRHHHAASYRAPTLHKHAPKQAQRQVPAQTQEASSRPLIVIDPGHGGSDPGAIGVSGTSEKTVTLATALELQRVLLATGHYRVALTRTGDRQVSLAGRLAFAQSRDADLLIAIHADASPDRHARGASVYVRSGEKSTQLATGAVSAARIADALSPTSHPEPGSAWLQYSMIDQLNDDVRMVAVPARTGHLYVLASRDIPSVLLEMGFLSNRQDEALLKRPSHRHVLVQAIKDAIDDYFAGITRSRT
jgi:N-acetylmuramoyl-L-alanine amidase